MGNLSAYKAEPTSRTPAISLEQGAIYITGRSIPENPGMVYRPVYNWISDYARNCSEATKIEFGFEYINTSSTKWIYNIIRELSEMQDLARKAMIYWYFEQGDEDMCELGFILRSLVDCPFVVSEVEKISKNREVS